MKESSYAEAIHFIYGRLKDDTVNWVITGSMNFSLHGIVTEVHDIDIQTDKDGVYAIEKRFKEFVKDNVRFLESDKIRSHFGTLEIGDVMIEIMGDVEKKLVNGCWDKPPDLEAHKEYIQYKGVMLPVLSLEYEYDAYLKLGRHKKADLLKNWLDRQ
jgi:hypothetical protein